MAPSMEPSRPTGARARATDGGSVLTRTTIMRGALTVGAVYNWAAALMLLLPGSLGRLLDLPAPGSWFYVWMLAFFIGLFGGVYAWQAWRPVIDRPIIAVAIVGKIGVFAVAALAWLATEISFAVVVLMIGDLLFAIVFLWWYVGARRMA